MSRSKTVDRPRPSASATMRSMVMGLSIGSLLLVTTSVGGQSLETRFREPSADAKLRTRWWWPGAAVTQTELRREIELLHANGISGAEIQSFAPSSITLTPDERAKVNDFAEPRFFADVAATAEAAAARGMSLDYTLGSAWPSGGGFAVTPEKALLELTMASTSVTGGQTGPIRLALPPRTKRLGALSSLDSRVRDPRVADWGKRMEARAKVVAVVAMRGTAPVLKTRPAGGLQMTAWSDVTTPGTLDPTSRIVLTDKLRADGTLEWTPPPGDWQLFVFKQYAVNSGVLGAVGKGPQLVVDHMDPTAFAAHVARTGDPLGMRPTGIRSTFVDSLELMQDLPWTDRFLSEFRARRGYDLTPYLPFLIQPGWAEAWNEHFSPPYYEAKSGDVGERVRTDYRRTVSDLTFAGFLDPLVAWNRTHGLKTKFQAHGGAIDIVRGYGVADIPETEDLVHDGDPIFMRFARSGADLYGRPVVSAESFVWPGRPYDVTPDDLRRRADQMFAGGVNSIVAHGVDYRFHADEWPGWHAFTPIAFSAGFSTMLTETNPVWPAVKPLATYIGRMQSVLQAGTPVVPIAYFYGQTGYYIGIEDGGAGKQAAEKAFIAAGYDFDRINPDSIAHARPSGRRLVAKSGHRYAALVLPPLDALRAETAEAIADFARAGVPVLFTDRTPVRDEGLADSSRRDARVRGAVRRALRSGARVVPEAAIGTTLRQAAVPPNLSFASDPTDLVFVQRRVDDRLVTFVLNGGKEPRDGTFTLAGTHHVNRWDAIDGGRIAMAVKRTANVTRVPLSLAPGESALLITGDAKTEPASGGVVETLPLPNDGWTVSASGHVARKPFTAAYPNMALGNWTAHPDLSRFAGSATYRRQFSLAPGLLREGSRLVLDLGTVRDMATVRLNGRTLPVAFTRPFRVDITGAARAGVNQIEVEVATTPHNAMFDGKPSSMKNMKPVPTGWEGPVRIERLTR